MADRLNVYSTALRFRGKILSIHRYTWSHYRFLLGKLDAVEAKVEEALASEITRVGWGGLTSYQFGIWMNAGELKESKGLPLSPLPIIIINHHLQSHPSFPQHFF